MTSQNVDSKTPVLLTRIMKLGISFLLFTLSLASCVTTKTIQTEKSAPDTASIGETGVKTPQSNQRTLALQKETKVEHIQQQFKNGIQLLQDGDSEAGRLVFEGLRDRYPGIAVFHINLGIAYKRLNRPEEAMRIYQQAIDLHGDRPETYYNLGILHRDQGDFSGAEAAYLKAIALSPEFFDAHYNLAVLYELYMDRPEAAIKHYRHYTELKNETNEEMKIWITGLEKRISTTRHKNSEIQVKGDSDE